MTRLLHGGRDGFATVVTDDGSTYAIVPASSRVRWTEASARAVLEQALADAATRAAVLEFAVQFGAAPEDEASALSVLTRALVDGSIVGFEAPSRPTGRPVTRRDPIAPPPVRPGSAVMPAWVSFELVDHEGTALGDRTLTFEHADGRLDSVTLDALGRSPRISTTSAGSIHLEWPKRLEAELDAPRMDGFVGRPDDVRVAREPLGTTRLGPNRHWRIVVDPPPRQPTTSFPSALFASNSALPMHAVADLVTIAHQTADPAPGVRLGVFAHSDLQGDTQANKELSDRRAQAVFALLTGDWPLFEHALAGETLPDDRAQALLRALGCNPTAIDGEAGEQTALAVRAFRRGYNDDVWHDEGRPRAYGDLDERADLDDATRKALIDAYHAEFAGRLDPARFLGPRHAGCSEFNPRGSKHADNRRVTLVVYGNDAPRAEEFPCVHDDAGACKVDGGRGDKPHFTCKFYRERIAETDVDHQLTPFWDFEWLRTQTGKAHLSALTHLPDSDDVTFVVSVVEGGGQPVDECGVGDTPPQWGERIAVLPGNIRQGVAYALWDHGPRYDPFDQGDWFKHPLRLDETDYPLDAYRPPVFSIAAHGRWGFSEGPGVRPPSLVPTLQRAGVSGVALAVTASGQIALVRRVEELDAATERRLTALWLPGHRWHFDDES